MIDRGSMLNCRSVDLFNVQWQQLQDTVLEEECMIKFPMLPYFNYYASIGGYNIILLLRLASLLDPKAAAGAVGAVPSSPTTSPVFGTDECLR